jgi:hypothetical protein
VTPLVGHALPVENQKLKWMDAMTKHDEITQSDIPSSPDEKPIGEESRVQNHDADRRDVPRLSERDHYLYARKKLKKAVLEHYRLVSWRSSLFDDASTKLIAFISGLELLQNYRVCIAS